MYPTNHVNYSGWSLVLELGNLDSIWNWQILSCFEIYILKQYLKILLYLQMSTQSLVLTIPQNFSPKFSKIKRMKIFSIFFSIVVNFLLMRIVGQEKKIGQYWCFCFHCLNLLYRSFFEAKPSFWWLMMMLDCLRMTNSSMLTELTFLLKRLF